MTAPNSLRFATFNASLNRDAEGQLIDPLFPLGGDFNPNVLPTGFPSSDRRLVWADVVVDVEIPDSTRKTVAGLDFLGEVQFETGLDFKGTQIGGLSGITYDPFDRIYYAISDDRSQINQARFYTLDIDLSDRRLDNGDIAFTNVTTLLNASGIPFPERSIDSEGIAFNSDGTLFISSEGDANNLLNPFVNEFSLSGQQFRQLTIPHKFLPNADKTEGIRNNLAFESLTITPDERYLYTAVESALIQDGSTSTLEEGSPVRILQYDLATGKPSKEFLYFTDPIPNDSNPPGGFADNGLVELIALDNTGTFLALERSFASGVGNSLRLYEVRLQGATDVSNFNSLLDADVDAVAQKRLLIDFGEIGIRLDNSEGMTLGPVLPDGRRSLIVVSDNNFSNTQVTQFLAFALDIDSIPSVTPTVETPSEVRYNDPNNPDADDPAIYVHPTDPSRSLVIGTLKDGGLAVYDLNGEELQQITPTDIRYNNVDLVYGFTLNGTTVDLAIASDRANDTLAIFQIDPTTRQLTDITAPDILATIFGEDDGEQTAYGLATYKSPVSGKNYVFVSQREGDKIAQLELIDNGSGRITAQIARIFTVPIPADGEVEDAQVEGMVVDRELGYLYVAQEGFGIWKFAAEPNAGDTGTLVDTVKEVNPNGHLEADAEGLTIYYGADGKGYLFASSQGDSTFTVYDRQGSNSFLGNFVIGEGNGTDSVEESDGADIINVPLGEQFPLGLMVVHDGSNDPAVIFPDPDDGEIQNFNTNFKYVSLENLADTLPFLNLDPNTYNPRNPVRNLIEPEPPRVVFGTPGDDNFDTSDPNSPFDGNRDRLFTGSGNDRVDASYAFGRNRIDLGSGDDIVYAGTNNRLIGGKGDDRFYLGGGGNRITGGIGADRFWVTTDDVNLPGEANIITDFKIADGDTIGFFDTHFSLAERGNAWDTRQVGNNTIIEVFGQDVAVLQGIRESLLSDATFIFG